MKELTQEVRKNIVFFTGFVFLLVLCAVTFLNTSKIFQLEAEIKELRKTSVEGYGRSSPSPIRGDSSRFGGDLKTGSLLRNEAQQRMKRSPSRSVESFANENTEASAESEFSPMHDEGVIRPRVVILDERHPKTGRIKPLPSIHFGGDTSPYVLGTHENYNGNGHLRHPNNIFVNWQASGWVNNTGMHNHFHFHAGYLTIKEAGLYLVYAQIYYLDAHDLNGYMVFKNEIMILQCTVQVISINSSQNANTCYTAGVEFLREGDRISLGDIYTGHYSVFSPGKSFFGVVKLGDVRARI